MYTEVEERVSTLEKVLEQFITQTGRSFQLLHTEMREFKDEMREFKDEMREFKQEMHEFKQEVRDDRKKMNQEWGNLANKLGTLVEDIVAPAVRPMIREYFKEEPEHFGVRMSRFDKASGIKGEFDVVAVTPSFVFVVEAKSSPNTEGILKFKSSKVERFRQLFPEYSGRTLIPIVASLYFDETLREFATKHGVYTLAYREWEYMDLLNFNDLNPSKT